jgi:serine/threonine-protein kinase
MEHLEGKDIGAKMSAGERFTVEEAVGCALEVIDAVSQAHKAGIVHRDLKPANLFLAKRPDGSHRIKVLDFGISKSLADSTDNGMRLTSTTTLIGSPLYMSPEQMQSARDVDGRADIWSLGAILFEMLANRPPYQANTLPQLCQQLLTADPPRLRQLRPDVPEGVESAVARCLMRNINERWQDVKDVAAALKPYSPRHHSQRPEPRSYPSLPSELEQSSDALDVEQQPGTLDPWGNTQARKQRSKNRLLLGVPLALLAVGVVAAVWVIRSKVDPIPTTGAAVPELPPAHAANQGPKPTAGASQPTPAGASQPTPERASTPGTIVTPVDSSEIALDEPPEPSAVRPPVAAQRPYVMPRPVVPVVAPEASVPLPTEPPKPDAPPDHVPASDMSDFGGRR